MLEQFARNTAQVQHYEAFQENGDTPPPPYELGFRDQIRKDAKNVKILATLWKQQYVWGKMGKSCGLTIGQANDVFDASVLKVGYDAKRVISTVIYLAKNIPVKEKLTQIRPNLLSKKQLNST